MSFMGSAVQQRSFASHEAALKRMPAGHRWKSAGSSGQPAWGWGVYILPYAEQTDIFDTLNPARKEPQDYADLLKTDPSALSSVVLQTKIPMYRCASDMTADLNKLEGFGTALKCQSGSDPALSTSNYVGSCGGYTSVSGSFTNVDPGLATDPGGVLFGFKDSKLGVDYKSITDGLSKTFVVGERCGADSMQSALEGNGQLAAVWLGTGNASNANPKGCGRIYGQTNFVRKLNSFKPGSVAGDVGKYYSSRHSGGAQFLFCDGSVAFINETVDPSTGILAWLGNRCDGNTVTLP